jgi:hypothetical protein
MRLGSVLALLLLAPSCKTTQGEIIKLLNAATEEFNDGIRWQKHGDVAARLTLANRSAYLTAAETADTSIKVSEVEFLRLELSDRGRRADVRYRYHWYRTAEAVLQKTVVVQHWVFRQKNWVIERITPGSGPAFPLFAKLAGGPERPRTGSTTTPPPEPRR